MNNLHRVGPGFSFNPMKKLEFSADYYALFADQDTPTRARIPTRFSNDGTFRGHMLASFLRYRHNEHLTAHLWSEFQWMGDYYADEDLMTFLRAEVLVTW
jgi:hypothetical protein